MTRGGDQKDAWVTETATDAAWVGGPAKGVAAVAGRPARRVDGIVDTGAAASAGWRRAAETEMADRERVVFQARRCVLVSSVHACAARGCPSVKALSVERMGCSDGPELGVSTDTLCFVGNSARALTEIISDRPISKISDVVFYISKGGSDANARAESAYGVRTSATTVLAKTRVLARLIVQGSRNKSWKGHLTQTIRRREKKGGEGGRVWLKATKDLGSGIPVAWEFSALGYYSTWDHTQLKCE